MRSTSQAMCSSRGVSGGAGRPQLVAPPSPLSLSPSLLEPSRQTPLPQARIHSDNLSSELPSFQSVTLHLVYRLQWGAILVGGHWLAFTDDPDAHSPWLHDHVLHPQHRCLSSFVDATKLDCSRQNLHSVPLLPATRPEERIHVVETARCTSKTQIGGLTLEHAKSPQPRYHLTYTVGSRQIHKWASLPLHFTAAAQDAALHRMSALREELLAKRKAQDGADADFERRWRAPEGVLQHSEQESDPAFTRWVNVCGSSDPDALGQQLGGSLRGSMVPLCDSTYCVRLHGAEGCTHVATYQEARVQLFADNRERALSVNPFHRDVMQLEYSSGGGSTRIVPMKFDHMRPTVRLCCGRCSC